MRLGTTLVALTGGVLAALLIATFPTAENASAGKRRKRKGGAMKLVDVNVGSFAGQPLNQVLEFKFTQPVDIATVNHAVFQIRGENANATGFVKAVPGHFQIRRNIVRFFPRLATHLRDPDKDDGSFYPVGSERDDAEENSGLQPSTNYEITVLGHPERSPVRSARGRRLNRSFSTRFTTAPISPRKLAYTLDTLEDNPPPRFEFSNPPDKVASVIDQYAKHGGTQDVPSDIVVSLFCNRVPLSPTALRQGQNTTLTLTERFGDQSQRRPVNGNVFVEQNFDTVRVVYGPDVALPDRGTFALRMTKNVKDITEEFDFANNAARLRIRAIYEFLDTARRLNPNDPPEQLQDPDPKLIFDWPPLGDPGRGVLKRNVLELGDMYPDEIDPRVMVLFTTRDEPVSTGTLALDFVAADGHYDSARSTASYDDLVPSAAAAIMTIAGGSAADGDYFPGANDTINTDQFANNTINWRRVRIPPGVVVEFRGTRPVTIRALDIQLEGEFRADGLKGTDASTKSLSGSSWAITTVNAGGAGGPGGGVGGSSRKNKFPTNATGKDGWGMPGVAGNDINGQIADDAFGGEDDDGGQGGLGGRVGAGSAYNNGGGGGGGGANLPGSAGMLSAAGIFSWRGPGGAGGAGSNNADLDPLVGAAGGASGGNAAYAPNNWRVTSGAGGGGGGAMRVQTSAILVVGTNGLFRSRGGTGGNGSRTGSTMEAGPGGGGGGGSLLLLSTAGFDFANPAGVTDVRGGGGGAGQNPYGQWTGGTGGEGYVRVADPDGAANTLLPGATSGVFDPVGGGVASFAYTLWIDLGVDKPRLLELTPDSFKMSPGNDAVLIEVQFAIEDRTNFGSPKLDALGPGENSTDESEVSAWIPIRLIDNTGGPPAFANVPGYNQTTMGNDVIFKYAAQVNGKTFKFVRVRITFQLDDLQTSAEPLPAVDLVEIEFEFNF